MTTGNGNGLTAEKMIDALKEARGFVSKACFILGCGRTHFYSKLKQYTTVQQALEDIREERTDFVENKLMNLIDAENVTAIIFYLKTQAKHRGYVERQEITGADGGKLTIEYVNDWRDHTSIPSSGSNRG
jgi:hypothetical protein